MCSVARSSSPICQLWIWICSESIPLSLSSGCHWVSLRPPQRPENSVAHSHGTTHVLMGSRCCTDIANGSNMYLVLGNAMVILQGVLFSNQGFLAHRDSFPVAPNAPTMNLSLLSKAAVLGCLAWSFRWNNH